MSSKKLRLLITDKCNRSCEGCCNKDWNLDELPIAGSFEGYDKVMLTGGEPMVKPFETAAMAALVKASSSAKVYMYTAKTVPALNLIAMLHWLDGLTITLHEQDDAAAFNEFNKYLMLLLPDIFMSYSLRLNVFEGVDLTGVVTVGWEVHAGMVWIEDCPLPEDEVFARISTALD